MDPSEIPDGPHEVIAAIAADARESLTPPPRSLAKWLVVLAVSVVAAFILITIAFVTAQQDRVDAHKRYVQQVEQQQKTNDRLDALTKQNSDLIARLQTKQAEVSADVNVALCNLIVSLQPKGKPYTADQLSVMRQLSCKTPG